MAEIQIKQIDLANIQIIEFIESMRWTKNVGIHRVLCVSEN